MTIFGNHILNIVGPVDTSGQIVDGKRERERSKIVAYTEVESNATVGAKGTYRMDYVRNIEGIQVTLTWKREAQIVICVSRKVIIFSIAVEYEADGI